MFESEFMRLAFAAGAVIGVLAPAVGFFLVQRRMSLIGDGIGHVAFAGVAAGGNELTYTYDTRGERTGITALLGDLNRSGIRFRDLQTTQSSLEDIFVDLVRKGQ